MIAAVSALLLSASCNRKYEYEQLTYATLYKTSYSVAENIGEVKIPVLLNNATGAEVNISVALTEGLAEEGTDYELISPASGMLTFSGETDSLDIVISIKSFEGEFTGSKDFSLEIASLSEGVSVGNYATAKVSISDLDHPLSPLLGNWKGATTEQFNALGLNMAFTINADAKDFTKVVVSTKDFMIGIPVEMSGTGEINSDGTGSIVIYAEQPLGIDLNAGPGCYIGLSTPEYGESSKIADIVMNLNADGTLTVPNGIAIMDDKYIYACYVGGYTMTKE